MLMLCDLQELSSSSIIKAICPLTWMLQNVLCEYILNWQKWRGKINLYSHIHGGGPHHQNLSCTSNKTWQSSQQVRPGLTNPFISMILADLNSWSLEGQEPCPLWLLLGYEALQGGFWLTFMSLTGVRLLGALLLC